MKPTPFILPTVIGLILCLSAPPLPAADWSMIEESEIVGAQDGAIREGHVFETANGNRYKVIEKVELFEYEHNPGVTVLWNGTDYKLIIEGFEEPLICAKVETTAEAKSAEPVEKIPSPQTVQLIQTALGRMGYAAGPADGVIGSRTRDALIHFQKQAKIPANGQANALSIRRLADHLRREYPGDPANIELAEALKSEIKIQNIPSMETCEEGHWVAEIIGQGGNIIKLEDGSMWEVKRSDTVETSLWITTEEVIVCNESMINVDNNERVSVTRLK